MIKNHIAATAALVAFGLAALAGATLAGPANADTGASESPSASETSSPVASGANSANRGAVLHGVLTTLVQLNRNLAAISQQQAESLAETNARLNARSSVMSSIPVVTVGEGTPTSAGSGQNAVYGQRHSLAPVSVEDDAKVRQSSLQVEKNSAQQ